MAEDGDDETFGDFAFAPFQSACKSTAAANPSVAAADDDWGDFLSSSQQTNPFDPSSARDKSPSRPGWTKPRGALPLSIFGDGEEDEEEGKGNSGSFWGFDQLKSGVNGTGDFNSTLGGKDAPNSQILNIADLYNRFAQIEPEDSVGAAASVDRKTYLRSEENASALAVDESEGVDIGKGGVEAQNLTSMNENLLGGWTQGTHGVSSKLDTTSPNLEMLNGDSYTKDQKQQLNGFDDGGDDEWEFIDAHNEKMNDNEASSRNVHLSGNAINSSKSHDVIGASNGQLNFFSAPTKSVDYFVTTNGFSNVDFFGNQMGVAAPNGWSADTKSSIEQTKTNNSMLNQSPGVGSEEFDEEFGEFTAASEEMESKPQEVSLTDLFTRSKGAATPTLDGSGKIQVDFMLPEVSKRNGNSSGSVFGESNGSIDLFSTSAEPIDFFATSSGVSSISEEVDLFSLQSTALNGFSSYTNSNTEQIKLNAPVHTPDFGAGEMDDDFGEFTAAATETPPKLGVDLTVDKSAERSDSFMSTSKPKKSLDVFEISNGSTNFFGTSSESVYFFDPSDGVSSTSQELDFSSFQSSTAASNGFGPEKNTIVEHNIVNGTLNHSPDVRDLEFEDDFGEFTAAGAETGTQTVEKGRTSKHQKGVIPLSIFGSDEPENEDPEIGGYSDVQDVFKYQSTSHKRNSHTPAPVLSINDLISSLYSQSEQASSVNDIETPTKTELSLSSAASNSSVNHFEDNTWGFKGAPQTRANGEVFLNSIGDTHQNASSPLKLNNLVDFYLRLKEELCFVIKQHIENQRHDGDSASLSGEDARAASLESEFQLVCKEHEQLNPPFDESNVQDHPLEESLKNFAGVLLEPQFQILELEYHLANKLLLAEKDERSAMELLRHTTTILTILTTGTLEDWKVYFSIWYDMISSCSQELKHGASIWNQAAEKQVQSQLLSEPQGRKYILGLGEIYRVVGVLGASAKLYKPWTFLGTGDLPDIYTLINECQAVWSTSGLDEALSNVSSPTSLSIKHILSLDALALQKYVTAKTESLCRLSLLTAEVVPGVKMVTWENQQCLVTLANLWMNMISRNPPKLPQLNIS